MNKDISMRKAIEGRFSSYHSVYLAYCYAEKIEPDKKYPHDLPLLDSGWFRSWICSAADKYMIEKTNEIFLGIYKMVLDLDFQEWLWDSVLEGRKIV